MLASVEPRPTSKNPEQLHHERLIRAQSDVDPNTRAAGCVGTLLSGFLFWSAVFYVGYWLYNG